MAVYTKLSENKLKEFFIKYNLGKLLDYKEIKESQKGEDIFVIKANPLCETKS